MNNVTVYRFSDLFEKIVDNRGKTVPTEDSGMPLIATNCIKNDSLYPVYENVRFISDETYKTWFRGHPEPNDLIFVLKGSPGRVCIAPDPVDFCIAQDMVALRPDDTKVYWKFLFALLRSSEMQSKIGNMHVGTLIPHFKKGDFDNLYLSIPDRKTQEFIGDLYFLISSKIELNRATNATLEALAQTLFKSWFVDFDIVKAKALGLEPKGVDASTAALFPSAFVSSSMGEIPEGWEIRGIDSIADFLNGLAMQKYPPKSNLSLPVIKIAQLRKGDTVGADRASTELPEDYIIQDGDVLFSWSGSLEVVMWTGGIGALNQHLFKVTSQEYPKWFYYLWTLEHLAEFRHIAESKATTMGHIQRKHLSQARVNVPPREILDKLGAILEPLVENMYLNNLESKRLTTTRDSLLPKLLSGEIEVGDIII